MQHPNNYRCNVTIKKFFKVKQAEHNVMISSESTIVEYLFIENLCTAQAINVTDG